MRKISTEQQSSPIPATMPWQSWRVPDVALRGLILAALWAVLNKGDQSTWIFGLPLVIMATLLSLLLTPQWRWSFSPIGLIRFALYFLRESLLSSVDVAARVFRPQIPLQPGLVRYRLRLPSPTARVIVANSTSLLPGTFSVDLVEENEGEHILIVHVLDVNDPTTAVLARLEEYVAGIYGLALAEDTA